MPVALRLLSAVVDSSTTSEAPCKETSQPPDYIVVLVALSCALISGIALALLNLCGCLRNTTRRSYLFPPGLKKETLQSLPIATYVSGVVNSSMECSDCVICLTEFCDGDLTRVLPQCGHVFHVRCIDAWLGCYSSCPSCRQLVVVVAPCDQCCVPPKAIVDMAGGEIDQADVRMNIRGHDVNGFLP